ncbi:ABC transporter substrate-binding protein [Rhodococcus fascians]|nr:ABC transporter substrate-binding protein [Rhodococcus fascians]
MDSPAEAYAPFWVGKEFGEFEKENIDLKIEKVPAAQFVQAGLTGQADVVLPGGGGLFNAVSSGANLRMVASAYDTDSSTGFYLSPKLAAEIPNFGPCDMKGRSVAVAPGGTIASASAVPISEYLAECDLTLKDVELSGQVGADSVVALQTGALDVAMEYVNLGAQAEQMGAKQIIPFPKDYQFAPWVFGPKLLEDPSAAAAVLRAMVRTVRTHLQGDYHTDPEVMAVLSQYEGLPDDTIASFPLLQFNPNLAMNADNLVTSLQQVWFDYGGVLSYNEPLKTDQVADFSILEKVVSTG